MIALTFGGAVSFVCMDIIKASVKPHFGMSRASGLLLGMSGLLLVKSLLLLVKSGLLLVTFLLLSNLSSLLINELLFFDETLVRSDVLLLKFNVLFDFGTSFEQQATGSSVIKLIVS